MESVGRAPLSHSHSSPQRHRRGLCLILKRKREWALGRHVVSAEDLEEMHPLALVEGRRAPPMGAGAEEPVQLEAQGVCGKRCDLVGVWWGWGWELGPAARPEPALGRGQRGSFPSRALRAASVSKAHPP